MTSAGTGEPAAVATPAAPESAASMFGARLPLAEAYARILATDGVVRGLIGPREVPRLWTRHLVNCAVLADELPPDAAVVDVGSGAGLPGLVLAIRRPDLQVTLVEAMQRRVEFLLEAVQSLGLVSTVTVLRGRAEEGTVRAALGPQDWVVARAVAPIDRLVKWCLPLLAPGGRLLALKGARAEEEVASVRAELRRMGAGDIAVRPLRSAGLDESTWVVSVQRSKGSRSLGRERRSR